MASRRAWMPNAYTWQVAEPFDGAAELAWKLQTTDLVAQVLRNRGLDEVAAARAFMDPQLTALHDPTLLGGAVPAAKRIARAVAEGEKIVIYGDYDVDGITGAAILHACLTMVGATVDTYVPHRLDEGYGVNAGAVAGLGADGAQLIVTVDCNAVREVIVRAEVRRHDPAGAKARVEAAVRTVVADNREVVVGAIVGVSGNDDLAKRVERYSLPRIVL